MREHTPFPYRIALTASKIAVLVLLTTGCKSGETPQQNDEQACEPGEINTTDVLSEHWSNTGPCAVGSCGRVGPKAYGVAHCIDGHWGPCICESSAGSGGQTGLGGRGGAGGGNGVVGSKNVAGGKGGTGGRGGSVSTSPEGSVLSGLFELRERRGQGDLTALVRERYRFRGDGTFEYCRTSILLIMQTVSERRKDGEYDVRSDTISFTTSDGSTETETLLVESTQLKIGKNYFLRTSKSPDEICVDPTID